MTPSNFSQLLTMLYATFGKTPPAENTPIRGVIWAKVQKVPDESCGWITNKLTEAEKMPANVGAAIVGAYQAWLDVFPEKRMHAEVCPHCVDGWLDCWSPVKDKMKHWVSPCPQCRDPNARTRRELEQAGVAVMPSRYKGGPVAFDKDNGFNTLYHLNRLRGENDFLKTLKRRIDMKQNPERLRSLTENERADISGW